MDRENTVKRAISPRETANFLSLVTFCYTVNLFIKGCTPGLELEDIYEIPPSAHSKKLGEDLSRQYRKAGGICAALCRCYGKVFVIAGLGQFLTSMIMTVWSPEANSKLISYFSPGTSLTKSDAFFYAFLVIGLNLGNTLVTCNLRLVLLIHGVKAKAAVASLLYRKTLKLSTESLSHVTAGKIVTIITKDVDIFEGICLSGNYIWIAVVRTVVTCYLVYQRIGAAAIPGMAFFLVVFPLQAYIGKLNYDYQLRGSSKTDERLNWIREVLTASKIIKMHTWERFFERKIHTARKEELSQLHKSFYSRVWITTIGSICSKVAFFISLMTHVWSGHNVSAETIYYILSCFGNLESSLSKDIPSGLAQIAQLFAVSKRIESVLKATEVVPTPNTSNKTITDGLNVVVGPTGSGKTTFLKTLLRESNNSSDLTIVGSVSYASQDPWVFPSTIKNNILFGEEYNHDRYQEVIRVCCLDYDLQLLPEGHNTLIGENGVNLSKGQQARVNLARAVYKQSDVYLLDDPLASLDASVSDQIFDECVRGFLANKIRIFVTNNTDHIKCADAVITVGGGGCIEIKNNVKSQNVRKVVKSGRNIDEGENKRTEIYHEKKRSGRVPFRAYYRYVQVGGGVVVLVGILCIYGVCQTSSSYSDKVLSRWVTLEQNLTNTSNHLLVEARNQELTTYTLVTTSSLLLTLVKSLFAYRFMQVASKNVHKKMVHKVVNSTMTFFDSYFIGNVINRFTKDFVTFDNTMPFVAIQCFEMVFTASGSLVLLTTVSYTFLLETLVFLVLVLAVKQFCQPAGRNLERLHVISRSPLTGHLNSTLEGLVTIRASHAEDVLTSEFDRHQNLFTSAMVMVVTNYNALAFFLDSLGTAFTGLVILQFLLIDADNTVGDVGLTITQSSVLTGIISSFVLSVSDCENLMVSAERIFEFTKLEEEFRGGKTLTKWPQLGSIAFNNVSLKNRDNTMLNEVTFVVNPGEKLGVVGRTGAGKSSLISSLLRLYPPRGTITIDGVDTNEVSLSSLRSGICVVPQDPYLFPGTVRENLDPLEEYADDQIWTVLKELQLDRVVGSLDLKIDKGATISSGQKQVLCLGRAVLRKKKIVVLDEITANVDAETSAFVQEVVERHFGQTTVVVIAHKLGSILTCDKVLVLDKGRVSEFGQPGELLGNKDNFLSRVVE